MKRWFLAVVYLGSALNLSAGDWPPLVVEAAQLELQGRLGEALDRYRAALSSVPALVEDESLSKPLTVQIYAKAAHLSMDLGYGEEAWDLSGRLLAAKNQRAAEAGTLVRLRFLRLQERWSDALTLIDTYAAAWPLPPPGSSLLLEIQRIRTLAKKSTTSVDALVQKSGGPAAWVLTGQADLLPGPAEAWDLSVQETARLQVGAFKDWSNALTLIDMLREKGWSPLTEVKLGAGGDKLHVVYVLSRQPGTDRARLEAQGLTALP